MRNRLQSRFPQGVLKTLRKTCGKACEKDSTVLTGGIKCGLKKWKSLKSGKVLHEFSNVIYTGFGGDLPLVRRWFYTFST